MDHLHTKKCCLCLVTFARNGTKSSVLPKRARHHLIYSHKLWCPTSSRVCSIHLIGNDLDPSTEVVLDGRGSLESQLPSKSSEIINDLLEVSHVLSQNQSAFTISFSSLDDSACMAWTGWSKDQFLEIHSHCSPYLSSGIYTKTTHDALLLFWVKLKTDISWSQCSSLFGISKSSVSKTFHSIVQALDTSIVPQFLGPDHLTREQLLGHNTVFSEAFFGDKATAILDGTYIYIQKSSDHKLQRMSYCGQKKRNYLKFMSIALPDGYILDTVGPFTGSENDATITKKVMDKLVTWLQPDDNVVVDRGFRDVLPVLEASGLNASMPSYLKPGQSQHSDVQANLDRTITKSRWIVESYHGRLKHWTFFRTQLVSNSFINVIEALLRTVTACLNGIRGPIYQRSPERDAKDRLMAERMKDRLTTPNGLAQRVKTDPDLSRRARSEFVKMDASSVLFPRLDLDYLRTITCGTYQISLAPGYIAEHLSDDGDYEVWLYQHSPDLLRCQIHSRHKSQTKYNVWIRFTVSPDVEAPIKDYYCQCPVGERTMGMCAHISSILYYLGYYRTLENPRPLQPQVKKFRQNLK